jgi:integrase
VPLVPFFDNQALATITPSDVERFTNACRRRGVSVKTIANYLGVLHGILEFAIRREWATPNPCKRVDRPKRQDADLDIPFLDESELQTLLQAVPDDDLGRRQAVLYLAAAMTGMSQGELVALRWVDVDWTASRIRVRRSFVRGEFGAPTSKRLSRSIPPADVARFRRPPGPTADAPPRAPTGAAPPPRPCGRSAEHANTPAPRERTAP